MFFKNKNLNNVVFGDVRFVNGWQSVNKIKTSLWGHSYEIYIKATALNKSESITKEQESSLKVFMESIKTYEKTIESVIREHFPNLSPEECVERFVPEEIIFSKNGSIGICIGDLEDDECGIKHDADIAILLSPEIVFYDSQEEYLCYLD